MDTKEDVLAKKDELVQSGAETLAAGGAIEGDFGLDDKVSDCADRDFQYGETVLIAEDAVVQDKERRQEGWTDIEVNPETGEKNPNYLPIDKRPTLEVNVKGCRGHILSGAYTREADGARMVPVELTGVNHGESLVYVDERKLRRGGERPGGKTSITISARMTDADRKIAADFTAYQAAAKGATLAGLAFPSFTDWLALKPKA